MISQADFNDKVRAVALILTLLVIGTLAIGGTLLGFKEVALVCVGSLVTIATNTNSYLNRGRVQSQGSDTIPPSVR